MCSMRPRPAWTWPVGCWAQPTRAATAATVALRARRLVICGIEGSSCGCGRSWPRRLPQLDLVTVRVDEPTETAVLVFLDLAYDARTARMHLAKSGVEIV